MRTVTVHAFDDWRPAARALSTAGVPPADVLWVDAATRQPGLLPDDPLPPAAGPTPTVPRRFVELARRVACHRDPERWTLLYRALWRLTRDDPALLERAADPDVVALRERDAAVRREAHKAKAFVRFRRVEVDDGEAWVAWHRPQHPILPVVGDFFADRFGSMRWTILTPDASLSWDGERLRPGPGVPRREAPDPDALEALWRTYYAHTFNPARVNLAAMKAEMPVHHWATLPETALIDQLVREAPERLSAMAQRAHRSAAPLVPETPPDPARALPVLAEAAARCDACPLYADATQTVFGEGDPAARIVIVGEQPGDQEDLAGHPFVGPAGQVLDRALAAAGIDRDGLYLTNAVKHFRHRAQETPRGKKRIHARPSAPQVAACRPWLDAELSAIQPAVAVALGATAAHGLLGRAAPVGKSRGEWHRNPAVERGVRVTWHPAAILRAGDPARADALFAQLVDDLRAAAAEAT